MRWGRASQRSEQGSALITVLIVLVLITLVGVVAIRQGLLGLNMATSSQMQTLLFHNADMGLDQVTHALPSQQDVVDARGQDGIIGRAIFTGQELVFCQKPTTSTRSMFGIGPNPSKSGVIQSDQPDSDLSVGNSDKFCDTTKSGSFLSSRQASLTQVAMMQSKEPDPASPFSEATPGNDSPCWQGAQDSQCPVRMRAYATAVLPAASRLASDSQINECLRKSNDAWRMKEHNSTNQQATDTVTDCLTRLGVPFNTQTDDFRVVVRIPSPRP